MPARPRSSEFAEHARIFGMKVRKAREARGLSQEELAHGAGISRNQIQHIEANRNNTPTRPTRPQPANPKLDTVFALADALDLRLDYLVDPAVKADPIKWRTS